MDAFIIHENENTVLVYQGVYQTEDIKVQCHLLQMQCKCKWQLYYNISLLSHAKLKYKQVTQLSSWTRCITQKWVVWELFIWCIPLGHFVKWCWPLFKFCHTNMRICWSSIMSAWLTKIRFGMLVEKYENIFIVILNLFSSDVLCMCV